MLTQSTRSDPCKICCVRKIPAGVRGPTGLCARIIYDKIFLTGRAWSYLNEERYRLADTSVLPLIFLSYWHSDSYLIVLPISWYPARYENERRDSIIALRPNPLNALRATSEITRSDIISFIRESDCHRKRFLILCSCIFEFLKIEKT